MSCQDAKLKFELLKVGVNERTMLLDEPGKDKVPQVKLWYLVSEQRKQVPMH
jgi:hypothetical protein